MKLLKLKVRNVATYNYQEIDFHKYDYPVFVTGKTGAGKTTLFIDAITAALYGNAYGIKRQGFYKELIMRGKKEGIIELEFEIGGTTYMIKRVFRETGSSDAYLWRKTSENRWISVAVGSKTVDKKIEEITGFSFDVLLNSAMVRQGDVYRFLDASPSERRELLIDILRIRLDKLKDKASNKRKKIESRIQEIRLKMAPLENQIKKKRTLEEERKKIVSKLTELKDQEEFLRKEERVIKQQYDEIIGKLSYLEAELKRIDDMEKELIEKINRAKELENEIANIESTMEEYGIDKISRVSDYLKMLKDYELGALRLENIRKDLKTLNVLLEKKKKLAQYKEELLEYEDIEKIVEEERKKLDELHRRRGELEGKLREIAEYLNQLDKAEAFCPVCGAPLSEDKKAQRRQHLQREKAAIKQELAKVVVSENQISELIDKLNKKLLRKNQIIALIQKLESEILKEEPIEEKIAKLESDMVSLTRELENKLSELERVTTFRDTSKIAEVLKEMEKIAKKLTGLDEKKRILNQLKAEIWDKTKFTARKEELLKELTRLNTLCNEIKQKLNLVESELEKVIGERNKLEERLRNIERELDEIRENEKKLAEYKRELAELELDLRAYEVLEKHVFAPGALPARLLESYIRILEDYCNDYLKKFGQDIDISLIYVRRRGDQQAIDMKVYASSYERDIRTFSGGERTLMGFAIRLAIGKLLAQLYAGAKRPKFLIIDEGFGPLDENLRSDVAKALVSLKESGEYEQIIVISHQQDLKNDPVFKTIIEVTKDSQNISHLREITHK